MRRHNTVGQRKKEDAFCASIAQDRIGEALG